MTTATTIHDIYKRYMIPSNLQLHMVRSAAIGQFIYNHWNHQDGPSIDKHIITTTLLLHDTGNIVKMNYDNPQFFKHEDLNRLEALKKAQQKIIAKYGTDDHHVSEMIARELDMPERVVSLIGQKIFVKNDLTAYSDDYELKITSYADQRVSPTGISSLRERLDEAKRRYAGKQGTSMNHPKADLFITLAYLIEEQVLGYTDLTPDDINDVVIKPLIDNLFEYQI